MDPLYTSARRTAKVHPFFGFALILDLEAGSVEDLARDRLSNRGCA